MSFSERSKLVHFVSVSNSDQLLPVRGRRTAGIARFVMSGRRATIRWQAIMRVGARQHDDRQHPHLAGTAVSPNAPDRPPGSCNLFSRTDGTSKIRFTISRSARIPRPARTGNSSGIEIGTRWVPRRCACSRRSAYGTFSSFMMNLNQPTISSSTFP